MAPTFWPKGKPLLIPEPGQRVRLRVGRGLWRGTFRAVSEPYTDETGEVVIRVVTESEYRDAVKEGRRTVGMPWAVRQMEVGSSSHEDDGESTQELSQRPDEEPGSPENSGPEPPTTASEGAQGAREATQSAAETLKGPRLRPLPRARRSVRSGHHSPAVGGARCGGECSGVSPGHLESSTDAGGGRQMATERSWRRRMFES